MEKRIYSKDGFSLVELMVVVSIIGVLAAIAIPNLFTFISKARQSEAKTNLAGIYSAEQTFFNTYNTYYDDLVVVGFRPVGKLRYNIGFADIPATEITFADLQSHGYEGASIPAPIRLTGTSGVGQLCGFLVNSAYNCSIMSDAGTVMTGTATTVVSGTSSSFVAGACGRIRFSSTVPGGVPGCETGCDAWTINEGKAIAHSQDGT